MKQGRSTALMAGILSVFSLSQCLGGITPVIARIGAAFPDIPSTTVMYVSTAASLAGIPVSLIAGQIAGRRLSLRAIAILSTVVMLVCGCIPALIPLFPVLLITRALFGFGMGAISVLGNPLVSAHLPRDRQPSALGAGTFAAFGGAMVMQLLAGALAALPLILMILFLPRDERQSDQQAQHSSVRDIPGLVLLACLLFGICTLLIAPLLVGSSLLAARLTESGTLMAAVSICYSIGCMLGGMAFGGLFGRFGSRCMAVALILTAIGMTGSALAGSILMLCAFIAIAGLINEDCISWVGSMPALFCIII